MQHEEAIERADHPQVVAVPPAAYVAAFVLGLIAEWVWRTSVAAGAARFGVGTLLFLAGLALMFAGLRAFRQAGTNVEVYRPATALVTTGPYRYTRNPIYVGTTVAYLGAGVLVDSLWVLGLVVPVLLVIHYGVVLREEAYLATKFGDAYLRYTRTVRRWL